MKKNQRGITLVALVVTIVVLLILAGVSINLVLGNNGIINKAKEARDKSAEASQNDLAAMDELAQQLENALNGSGSGNGGSGSGSGSGTGDGSDTKVPAAATTETAPYFPDSTFTKKEGTIDTGLVIQDSARNEYVWVVVPRTLYDNTNYNSNGAKKPSSSTDYENIEYCLQQYTSTYRNGTSYSDTWAADTDNVGWLTSDEYTELKNQMLKSVCLNGGFYVGRYEAGIGTNRTSDSDGKYDITGLPTPLSQADAYPYTWVTRTQAQNLAKSLSNGKSYTSSLMFGVQWDLVLAFMAKDTNKITSTTILTSDSTTIGNYDNNSLTITNTKAQYTYRDSFTACPNPFKKESGILLTTGADSSFSVQNIYDIAGNVEEWTLEYSSTSRSCALTGGFCYLIGSIGPASNRYNGSTTDKDYYIGFRVSLF